jgi:diguanylate cyclase (GGDEF)-like protein
MKSSFPPPLGDANAATDVGNGLAPLSLARGLAVLAAVGAVILFGLQSASAPWPLPLPADTGPMRPLSVAGDVLGAAVVAALAARRPWLARTAASVLGLFALGSLAHAALTGVQRVLPLWSSPPVALAFLLVAFAGWVWRPDHRLRRTLSAAAGIAGLVLPLTALLHYAWWSVAPEDRLYLLTLAPTSALPLVLLSLSVVALAFDGVRRRTWRRHGSLLAWSGVFTAVLVGAWGLAAWSNARHVLQESEHRLEGLSQVLQEHFSRSLDPADLLLQQVVDEVARGGLDGDREMEAALRGWRTAIGTLQQLDAVVVFDPQGGVRFSSHETDHPAALTANLRPAFDAIAAGADMLLGPMVRDAAGRWTFTYGRRLRGPDGAFAGVALATMRTHYYLDFYHSLALGPDASIAVFLRDGRLVLRDPEPRLRHPGLYAQDRLFREFVAAKPAGVVLLRSPFDQRVRLLGYRTSPVLPVVVLAAVTTPPMAAAVQRQCVGSAALLAMALLLLAWAVTQQLEAAEREREVQQRLREGRAELERLATTDSLTGLATRRQFEALAGHEIARHQRSGEPMALLMLDVDHFKRVNDNHGHAAGDAVLRAVAQAMRETVREADVVGRLGGEEFAAVLVTADETDARRIAERLRQRCGRLAIQMDGAPLSLRITVSIGLAAWQPEEATIGPSLRRADAALYRAKRDGRDRVVADAA